MLEKCLKCGGELITEQSKKIQGAVFYYYECENCGNKSEFTIVQNLSPILWNNENKDIQFVLDEIIEVKEEMRRVKYNIDDLEDDLEYYITEKDSGEDIDDEIEEVQDVINRMEEEYTDLESELDGLCNERDEYEKMCKYEFPLTEYHLE